MTIIKEGVIGHFLSLLEEKLHVKIEYSIAGIYYFSKPIMKRLFCLAVSSPEVSINIGARHKIFDFGVLRTMCVSKDQDG
jgi:hypothetical protein